MTTESDAMNQEIPLWCPPELVTDLLKPEPSTLSELAAQYPQPAITDLEQSESQKGWKNRRLAKVAVIGMTVGALAFEQSPANESVRATGAFNVLELDEDVINNDQKELIAASLAVGGMTIAIEGITATILAYGLNQHSETLGRYTKRFTKKLEESEDDPKEPDNDSMAKKSSLVQRVGGALTDTGITSTLGPGMVVFRRHLQETDRTFNKDVKTGLGYTAVGAAISTGIAYLVLGGVEQAEKVGLEAPAEFFADNATDWKFWTTLLVGGYGVKWAAKKTKQGFKAIFNKQHDDEAGSQTDFIPMDHQQ